MKKGDIILIPFPFTDLTGNKLRPASVLACSDKDVTVAFISTKLRWKERTLSPSSKNGLKKESLLRISKLATIDRNIAAGLLGELEKEKIEEVNDGLKAFFELKEA